jgi:hypothetical protein
MRIHPKKGVNPRMSCCFKCGKDVGIVLLGVHEKKYQCNSCDLMHIGGIPKNGMCPCGSYSLTDRGKIGEYEKIPSEICPKCEAIDKEMKSIVADGGIYWKCKDCKSDGAIKKDHPICAEVRKELDIPAPKSCGVELSKEKGCPVCNEEDKDVPEKNQEI